MGYAVTDKLVRLTPEFLRAKDGDEDDGDNGPPIEEGTPGTIDAADLIPLQAEHARRTPGLQATPEEVAKAYLLWATDPDHKLGPVAKAMGRSVPTIRAWYHRYGWQDMYGQASQDAREAAKNYLSTRMAENLDTAVEELVNLMRYGEGQVKLGAIKTLINVVAPPVQGPAVQITGDDNRQVIQLGAETLTSPADIQRFLSAQIARNMDQSIEAQGKKKR